MFKILYFFLKIIFVLSQFSVKLKSQTQKMVLDFLNTEEKILQSIIAQSNLIFVKLYGDQRFGYHEQILINMISQIPFTCPSAFKQSEDIFKLPKQFPYIIIDKIISSKIMSERKSWKPEEDQILKLLYEQRGMTKWNQIAIAMKQQFGIFGRNGKQCRQRYHNHLDTSINKGQWSLQEEKQLIQLHNQQGNKWAEISKKLPGRTDNCVKNKFYSKLRKGIKILNQHISQYFKKKFKLLKPEIIYKILEISDQKYKTHSVHSKQAIQAAVDLKNQLLITSDKEETIDAQEIQKIQQFISELNIFNKKNRRRGKKRIQAVISDNQDDSQIIFQEINNGAPKDFPQNKNQPRTLHTSSRVTRLKQKQGEYDNFSVSINDMMSSELKRQENGVCQIIEYLDFNQDLNMGSLINLEDKQDEEKTIKASTMSNTDFQIDLDKVLMNDVNQCWEQFLRKDIYGYQEI